MSAPAAEILEHANVLLDAHAFSDYGPIGLQVTGRTDVVDTIATSVSSTLDAFERAATAGAQLLLVHHGLFWKGTPQVIDPIMRERLSVLFEHGITLAGYHLCLDAHPHIGNNALISDALGLQRAPTPFASHEGRHIGCIGELEKPTKLPTLTERLTAILGGRTPLVLGARPRSVRRVAICSGGGASYVNEAAALGCDVLITGEPREDTHALSHELGITCIAGGHHATEVFGIRALGETLARRFDLAHRFLDADNPV